MLSLRYKALTCVLLLFIVICTSYKSPAFNKKCSNVKIHDNQSMKSYMKPNLDTENLSKSITDNIKIESILTITISSIALFALPSLAVAASEVDPSVARIAKPVIDIFINVMNLLFLSRTVISW